MPRLRVDFTASCLIELDKYWTPQLEDANPESFDEAVISALRLAWPSVHIDLEDVCPVDDEDNPVGEDRRHLVRQP